MPPSGMVSSNFSKLWEELFFQPKTGGSVWDINELLCQEGRDLVQDHLLHSIRFSISLGQIQMSWKHKTE